MVCARDRRERRQERRAGEHALGLVGVEAHLLPLVGVQRPRLLPGLRADRDPPEVVHKRRPPQAGGIRRIDPAAPSRFGCELGDSRRVSGQVGRDEIGEVAHRGERAIEPLASEHKRWARLANERLVPRRLVLAECEDLLRAVCQAGRDLGIERVPRALADEMRGTLHSTQQTLEGRVNGDVHDPHLKWDSLTLRAAKRSPTVPPLREIGEKTRH